MTKAILLLLFCASVVRADWTREMDSLAKVTECRYRLPHGICRAFALQESGYRPKATRVETGYFNVGSRYYRMVTASSEKFADTHKWADPVTEQAYESISFGLFQIMGFNLRALGYENVRLPAITLAEQFEYFGRFVQPLFKRYGTLARVASAYNTGSPDKTYREYVTNILKYQRQYSY